MNKIKIFESVGKPVLFETTYDSCDIDSIAIAEQERKDAIERIFKEKNLKEVLIITYENGIRVSSSLVINKDYKDTYCFILSLKYPHVMGVYNNIQKARLGMIDYFKKHHSEFDGDEIIEIVNDLVGLGHYDIGDSKYYFSSHVMNK